MSDEKSVRIDREELGDLQDRLAEFMKDLPDNQRGALELVLARAASSQAPNEVVNGFLDVTRKDKDASLSVLARALDGRSNVPTAAGNWFYNIWTHHHK